MGGHRPPQRENSGYGTAQVPKWTITHARMKMTAARVPVAASRADALVFSAHEPAHRRGGPGRWRDTARRLPAPHTGNSRSDSLPSRFARRLAADSGRSLSGAIGPPVVIRASGSTGTEVDAQVSLARVSASPHAVCSAGRRPAASLHRPGRLGALVFSDREPSKRRDQRRL
jgi:hypothetical protein